jgi:hypothetical protein
VNGIDRVLAFNVRHFLRFAAFVPGLAVVSPESAANAAE